MAGSCRGCDRRHTTFATPAARSAIPEWCADVTTPNPAERCPPSTMPIHPHRMAAPHCPATARLTPDLSLAAAHPANRVYRPHRMASQPAQVELPATRTPPATADITTCDWPESAHQCDR